jgi:hypothetical protein
VRWSPECYGFWAAAPRGEICPRRSSGRGKRSTLATVNGAEKVSGSALWRYSTHDKCESVAVGLDPWPAALLHWCVHWCKSLFPTPRPGRRRVRGRSREYRGPRGPRPRRRRSRDAWRRPRRPSWGVLKYCPFPAGVLAGVPRGPRGGGDRVIRRDDLKARRRGDLSPFRFPSAIP